MSVLGGFEDLKTKDVITIDNGVVLFMSDGKLVRRQLTITPSGSLSTREIEPVPIDQEGMPKRVPVGQRWATTDQGSAMQ
jgi:hypothetical protein